VEINNSHKQACGSHQPTLRMIFSTQKILFRPIFRAMARGINKMPIKVYSSTQKKGEKVKVSKQRKAKEEVASKDDHEEERVRVVHVEASPEAVSAEDDEKDEEGKEKEEEVEVEVEVEEEEEEEEYDLSGHLTAQKLDPGKRSVVALSTAFPPTKDIPSLVFLPRNKLLEITALKPTGEVFKERRQAL